MPQHPGEEDKPCRACSDFKTWSKLQGSKSKKPIIPPKPVVEGHKDCPLDKDELGRSTWGLLHTMASYFPEKPNNCQTEDVVQFFNIFAKFYPCEPCALDFQEDIKENPPKACTRDELAKWLCDRHNTVNKKLGKPLFDCSKVHERWRDGWADGSCD
ncbi:FAD-linked sulfhydryl oxidase ALR [Aricia agestis]|uniref:FAD-linked sulfhydryl oxidase ALR n=1 Tax=Aricia agestis TaxID=91739 RepID=UPI001C20A665|nr:FAD-linked sulfhydryl oxidase ALR [Aricia agestis]